MFSRQFDKVPAAAREAEALDLGHLNLLAYYTENALLASGQFEQGRAMCESAATSLDEDERHYCLALAYHALSRQTDAEREFEKFKTLDADAFCDHAAVYAQWGDKMTALQSLARAERMRSPCLQDIKAVWALDPLRDEPQFKSLIARMKFPP